MINPAGNNLQNDQVTVDCVAQFSLEYFKNIILDILYICIYIFTLHFLF